MELKGVAELIKKLEAVGGKVAVKALRSTMLRASNPAFRAAKMAAPVGTVGHRTYKDRIVTPGFTRRSIARQTYVDVASGLVGVNIGVHREAFYAVQFYDRDSPVVVTHRKKKPIKPYALPTRRWLSDSFEANQSAMEKAIADELEKQLAKLGAL